MQFRLSSLLLLFVLLASSMGLFGTYWGVVATCVVLFAAFCTSYVCRWEPGILWAMRLVAVGGVAQFLLLPGVGSHRGGSSREACCNNLKQVALAIHDYFEANGSFPPAYVTDRSGRRMHSWRVLILPYLGYESLYREYDFNEPWDGPNNQKLLAKRPNVYACPDEYALSVEAPARTAYLAVVGKEAAWQGEETRNPGAPPLAGKLHTTVMLVETADSSIAWTQPDDYSLDALKSPDKKPQTTISSWHGSARNIFEDVGRRGRANIALGDASVRPSAHEDFFPETLHDTLKIGGYHANTSGHIATTTKPETRPLPPTRETVSTRWPNYFLFAIWLASAGLVLIRAERYRRRLVAEQTNRPRPVGDRPEEQPPDES